jgi:uncharacterized protein YqeY
MADPQGPGAPLDVTLIVVVPCMESTTMEAKGLLFGRQPTFPGSRPPRVMTCIMESMINKAELEKELHSAMRSGDELRKRTLRMILSSVKLAEVEKRGELDEAGMTAVLSREVKTRQEAIADAEKAQRPDLAAAAQAELDVVQAYLPAQLPPEELEQLARQAIAATGAAGPQDMGKVMKEIMPRVQGRADGKTVNEIVRRLLTPA